MNIELESELRSLLSSYSSTDVTASLSLCDCLRATSDLPAVSDGPRGCVRLRWGTGRRKLSVDIAAGRIDWFFCDPVRGNLESGEVTSIPVFSSVVLSGFLYPSNSLL